MKRLLVAVCLVLCMTSSAFCIDPFKVNQGGFGPKIKGLQLGMKMPLLDLIVYLAANEKLSDTLSFRRTDKDGNYNDSNGGNYIKLKFISDNNQLKSFEIVNAEGVFADFKHNICTLGEVISAIESEPYKCSTYLGIERDNNSRITSFILHKSDFGAKELQTTEFIQAFVNAYSLSMKQVERGKWECRNVSEGWSVTYIDNWRGDVVVQPIVSKYSFN